MKVHHVGYLVESIAESKFEFEKLGYNSRGNPVIDSTRGIEILFMNNGSECIELVASMQIDGRSSSIVSKLQKKIGNSPYHICYECDALEEKINELCEERGYILLHAPAEAPAISGKRVAFLYQANVGMIELVES